MKRRHVLGSLAAPAAALALPALAQPGGAGGGRKVLRIAFNVPESGFDPAKFSDLYSRTVNSHIFEALYGYDHLALPAKIKPVLADGMPEVSADFKAWTVRLKRGIFYADDPAFKGQRREVMAADAAYAFKRAIDPATKSPFAAGVLDYKMPGLAALREAALKERKPFDYDAPIPGMQVLDRYTVRFTFEEPRPRFLEVLAQPDIFPLQAREVVEFYGDRIAEHPVGSGPFRLARERWVRSSLIVLERSPHYREVLYDAEPAADDAEGQAVLARLKGRRLPIVDEVQISIIEENQPRWLSFVGGQIDGLLGLTGALPSDYVSIAIPNSKLAPFLRKAGVQHYRRINADCAFTYFNMEDPVVGGYEPAKVALRRAISLGLNVEREIHLIRRGQAIPAQSLMLPYTSGYDPAFKSEMGDYDPARARALLDMHGYIDRDGDGWRELPDGRPLVLRKASEPQQISRQFDELWSKDMAAIGIKVQHEIQQWPANMKQALAGQLQVWTLGNSAAGGDGQSALMRLYGPQAGQQNLARFKNAEIDRLYEKMSALPDGPERDRMFLETKRITVAYMPYKVHVHRIANDLAHPWVIGFRRPLLWNEWWHVVDVDTARRPAPRG